MTSKGGKTNETGNPAATIMIMIMIGTVLSLVSLLSPTMLFAG